MGRWNLGSDRFAGADVVLREGPMLLLVLLRILVVVVMRTDFRAAPLHDTSVTGRFVLDPSFREVRMVGIRFSHPAMWLTAVTFTLAACGAGTPAPPIQVPVPTTAAEAPTGFDNRSNGVANDSIHQADQDAFDEVEEIADGLGPLYNAQACRECHQNPTSGGASQITELRVGHLGPDGRLRNACTPNARGAGVISR